MSNGVKKEIKQGDWNELGRLHFCLILPVPFSSLRRFVLSKELPLILCVYHCINFIFKSIFAFLQCLLFAMFVFRKVNLKGYSY